MTRKRLLELTLAVVCVIFIPMAIVNFVMDRQKTATAPPPARRDPKFVQALQAGIDLEKQNNCEQAFNKFIEAEYYASKMTQGKNAAFREAAERVVSCSVATGNAERANNARKQLIRFIIEDGVDQRNAGHLESAVANFREAERRTASFDPADPQLLQDARVPLADALWKLGKTSEAEEVFSRMTADVQQPLNDSTSVFGHKYMEVAQIQSKIGDWSGAAVSCQKSIEEFDKTIASYSATNPSVQPTVKSLAFDKSVAMKWLQIAYARDKKYDLSLQAAQKAYAYAEEMNVSAEVKRQIADLAVDTAKTAQRQIDVASWQQKLASLPANPCPAPNINNPNCITPSPDSSRSN